MAKLGFKGNFNNEIASFSVSLFLFHFVENKVHLIYCPHLDITGYGYTLKEAKDSFEVCFAEFLDYTTEKGTLAVELKRLGWTFKGSSNGTLKLNTTLKVNNFDLGGDYVLSK